MGEPLAEDKVQEILISGVIVRGDAEKLIQAMFSRKRAATASLKFLLDSPGGDLSEAIKLAKIFKALHAQVHVLNPTGLRERTTAPPHMCASSCFLLYAAGDVRITRKEWGRIGVHRPYFKKSPGSIPEEVDSLRRAFEEVEALLKEYSIATHLIDKLGSLPSNEIYWLSDKDLYEIGHLSPQIEEIAIRECGYRREQANWFFSVPDTTPVEDLERSGRCMVDLLHPEVLSTMKRLQKGWRPY